MHVAKEFLESSTIHGLSYISTAKSRCGRFAWLLVVLVCTTIAFMLISNSYRAWSVAPVSTSTSTHSITKLKFPNVTICPPKGSNTGLNYDLANADNSLLKENDIEELQTYTKHLFIVGPQESFVETMKELRNDENIRNCYIGRDEFTTPHNDRFVMKTGGLKGSFKSPLFGEEYLDDYYRRNESHHYTFHFPDNITDIVGEGSFIIELTIDTMGETEDGEEYVEYSGLEGKGRKGSIAKRTFTQYPVPADNPRDAEDKCIAKGGHLASVISEEENQKVTDNLCWIGGTSENGKDWSWMDGSPWTYTNWLKNFPTGNYKCLGIDGVWKNKPWLDWTCVDPGTYVCIFEKVKLPGSLKKTLIYKKDNISTVDSKFNIWWDYKVSENSIPGSWKGKKRTGFSMEWRLENKYGVDIETEDILFNNEQLVRMTNLVFETKQKKSKGDLWNQIKKEKNSVFVSSYKCEIGTSLMMDVTILLDNIITENGFVPLPVTDLSKVNQKISKEDLNLGYELFSYLIYCDKNVMEEALNLNHFHLHLLSRYTPRGIIQATMNNLRSGKIKERKNIALVKQFYKKLYIKYSLELGRVAIALSTKLELQEMMRQDFPYLESFSKEIRNCFDRNDCEDIKTIITNLGKF